MSRKHRRNKVNQVEQARPQASAKSGLVASFSEKVNQPMNNANDLMNYIIFGDAKQTFSYSKETF